MQSLVLLGTLRSDEPSPAHSLAARRVVSLLDVPRLDEQAMMRMAEACLGAAAIAEPVRQALMASAEGLPLLVEDLLAEWLAAGQLAQAGEDWQASHSQGLPRLVPLTFGETVRRRLAELGEEAAAVLRLAALLGRRFDWRILPDAAGMDDERVVSVLQQAVQRQLISVESGRRSDTFRFRHALTQAAVLADLLPLQRVRLAARLLDVVQQAYAGLPGEWCELAASLAEESEQPEKAAALLLESGRRALARGALATAEATLRHALETCRPASPVALDAQEALLEALALAGKHEEIEVTGSGLLAGLQTQGVPAERLARAHLRIARALVAASKWAPASEHLQQARQIMSASAGAPAPEIDALAAHVALGEGRLDEARQLAEGAVQAAEPAGRWEVACEALEVVGRIARHGQLREAEAAFRRALSIAEEHGLAVWRLRALHELGTIDLFTPGAGPERLQQALELAEQAGALSLAAMVHIQLAAMYLAQADFETGIRLASRSADIAQRLGLGPTRAVALQFIAEAHGRKGDRPAMEAALRQAAEAAAADPALRIEMEANAWGDARAYASLVDGDRPRAAGGAHRCRALPRDARWRAEPQPRSMGIARNPRWRWRPGGLPRGGRFGSHDPAAKSGLSPVRGRGQDGSRRPPKPSRARDDRGGRPPVQVESLVPAPGALARGRGSHCQPLG